MKITYYDELPSTNSLAAEAAREGCEELFAVVARRQSAGRGRLSRSFFSPRGGLYFSTVLRPDFPMADYGRLTPFAAVAVWRALSAYTQRNLQIKWVNDILLDGKKLCGILAESGTDRFGKPFVILGIGINTARVDFPPDVAEIATYLEIEDTATLAEQILHGLKDYNRAVFENAWVEEYRAHAAFLGEKVRVVQGDEAYLATVLDIEPDGALLLRLENGEKTRINGGEISIRPAQKDED